MAAKPRRLVYALHLGINRPWPNTTGLTKAQWFTNYDLANLGQTSSASLLAPIAITPDSVQSSADETDLTGIDAVFAQAGAAMGTTKNLS